MREKIKKLEETGRITLRTTHGQHLADLKRGLLPGR